MITHIFSICLVYPDSGEINFAMYLKANKINLTIEINKSFSLNLYKEIILLWIMLRTRTITNEQINRYHSVITNFYRSKIVNDNDKV